MEPTITTIYVTIKDDYRPKLVLELLDGHVDNLEIDLHGIIVLPKNQTYHARILSIQDGKEQELGQFPIENEPFANIGLSNMGGSEIQISITLSKVFANTFSEYKMEILSEGKVVASNKTILFFSGDITNE